MSLKENSFQSRTFSEATAPLLLSQLRGVRPGRELTFVKAGAAVQSQDLGLTGCPALEGPVSHSLG